MRCVLIQGTVRLQVHMVFDKVTGKPRGYAFVEFEDEADMHGEFDHFFCPPVLSVGSGVD